MKSLPRDTPRQRIEGYLGERLLLMPAGSGVSDPQRTLRRPLLILSALVVLVLLIACMKVANLMTVRAMARAREMALRLSIGAGRWRLIQLVLVESALLALFASAVGALFAWWAAPFVLSLLDSLDEPVRLVLDADARVLGVGIALTIVVPVLFGLAPALRAFSVKPLGALKTNDDTQAHRQVTRGLIGAQMALCTFVLFVAGLFVTTFQNLSSRPLGFSPDHLAVLEINVQGENQSPTIWSQVVDRLRSVHGVESAALSMWVPLSGNRWRLPVSVGGQPAEEVSPYFLGISPAFFETMRIGMIAGRDFRLGDAPPRITPQSEPLAGVGIVSESFARVYFAGESPVGQHVSVHLDNKVDAHVEVVGLVKDIAYDNIRDAMRPTVYLPTEDRNQGALVIRTAGDPLTLAPLLRTEVTRARTDFRVTNVGTQTTFVRRQMIRERLLAALSLFFAVVALVLAGIGLYGVLNYIVVRRRQEIGVRMALGARPAHVVSHVTTEILSPVVVGAVIGLAAGLAVGRVVESLLFDVKTTSPAALAAPLLTLVVACTLATLEPAIRAVRTNPALTLRSE